jgi:hypothetical protein
MRSLTRVNPNDNGVETFIVPNNASTEHDEFPQFDAAVLEAMKTRPGDVFGLTTLPQVAAIAVPKLSAATNSLLDLARAAQEDPAATESRLRRSLEMLAQGQVPRTKLPTLPTAPTLPRSLDLPERGALRARLQQHRDDKLAARMTRTAPVVVAAPAAPSTGVVLAPVAR